MKKPFVHPKIKSQIKIKELRNQVKSLERRNATLKKKLEKRKTRFIRYGVW